MAGFLGIDCGSISLNLVLSGERLLASRFVCTEGFADAPLHALIRALDEVTARAGNLSIDSAMVTGSARDLFSQSLNIPAINEITAHATGVSQVNPRVRTVIEVGGQDSKFIKIDPSVEGPDSACVGISDERGVRCRYRSVSGRAG